MSSSQNNEPRKSGSKRKQRKSRTVHNEAAGSNKNETSLTAANCRSLETAREGLTNKEECNLKNKFETLHGRLNELEGEQNRNKTNIEAMTSSLKTVCDRVSSLESSEKKVQEIETRLASLDSRNENILQETRMCREERAEQKTSVENLKERLEQLEIGTLKEFSTRLSQVESSNESNAVNVSNVLLNLQELKQMSSESLSRINDTEITEISSGHLKEPVPNILEENAHQDYQALCGAAASLSHQNEINHSPVKDDIENVETILESQPLAQLEEKEESNSKCIDSVERDCLQNGKGKNIGVDEEEKEENRGCESVQVNVEETELVINGKEDRVENEVITEVHVSDDGHIGENIGESENNEEADKLEAEVHGEVKLRQEIEDGIEHGQKIYETREDNINEIAMQDENIREMCGRKEEGQRIREKIESEGELENDAEKSDENWTREIENAEIREMKNEKRLEGYKQEEFMDYEEGKCEIKGIEGEVIGIVESTRDEKRDHNIRKRGVTAGDKVKCDDVEDQEVDIEKQTKIENEIGEGEDGEDVSQQKEMRSEEKENYERNVSSEEISLSVTLNGMQALLDNLKLYTQINLHDLYDSLNRQDDSLKKVVLRLTRIEEKCGSNKLEEADKGKNTTENDSVTGHLGENMEGEVKEEEVLGTGESSRRGNEGEGGECLKAREACVEPSSCSSTSSASSSADRIQLGERGLEGIPRATCIPTGPPPELCTKVYHLPEGCRRERPSIPDSDVGRREGSLRRMSGDAAGGTRPFREAGSREESLTAMSGYGTTGARPFIEVGDGDVDVFDWLQTLSSYADWLRHRQRRDYLEHESNNLNENVITTTAPATATQGGVPAATATVGIAVAPVSAPVSTSLTPVAASTSIPSVAPTRVSTGTDPITLDTPCDASVPTTAVTSLRHHVNASAQTFPAPDTALTRVSATESTFSSVDPCSVDAGYVNRTPAVVSAGNDPLNSHSNHGAVLPVTVISPRPVVDASSQTSPSLANSFALPPNISTGPTAVPSLVSTITDGSSDRAPAVVSTGTDPFNSDSDHAGVRSATSISPRPMADACSQTFTSTSLAAASSTVSTCSTVVPSSLSTVTGGLLNHTLTFASTGTDSFDLNSDQATAKSATIISPRSVADASSQTNSTCPTGAPFPISSIKGDSSNPAPACVSVGTGTEPVPSVSHASVSTSISIPCRAKDAGSQTQEHEEEEVAVSLLAVNTPSTGDGKTVFFFGCEEDRAGGSVSTAANCARPGRERALEDTPHLTHLSQILKVSGSRSRGEVLKRAVSPLSPDILPVDASFTASAAGATSATVPASPAGPREASVQREMFLKSTPRGQATQSKVHRETNGAACDAYDENAALLVAAERGRVGCVLGVVDEGLSRNESSGTTVSALTVAAQRGHVGYVRALLTAAGAVGAAGAAAAEEDEDGWTALHWAAHWGHAACARALLDAGADPRAARPRDGWTPLHVASWRGHLPTVRVLLAAGADAEATARGGGGSGGVVDGGSGWRPLHCAARGGHCACAGELLRAGADPRRRAADGARPVDVAAGEDVRRVLLEAEDAAAAAAAGTAGRKERTKQ